MSWPECIVIVSGLAALVGLAHTVLPYVRRRNDVENRLAALEAANVQLADKAARLEQWAESGGTMGALMKLRGVSR